jgi:hypothetical protein
MRRYPSPLLGVLHLHLLLSLHVRNSHIYEFYRQASKKDELSWGGFYESPLLPSFL